MVDSAAVLSSSDNNLLWNSSNSSANATTSPTATEPALSETGCEGFLVALYVVVFGSMAVLGLVGNTLSFIVLRREHRMTVATFLLCALAVADNLYLLVAGLSLICSTMTVYTQATNAASEYLKVILWPLVYVAQLCTIWITVLIAFNRYIAICKPFRASMLCTMTKTRTMLGVIIACCVLYNIPRFLEKRVILEDGSPVSVDYLAYEAPHYTLIYESILYCFVYLLIPLLVLTYFNSCLIKELILIRQRQLKRQLPKSNDAEENNLTLVMVVIILVFILCQTPAAINQVLSYTISHTYYCASAYFYFYHISNVVALANSCLNFVIYCVFRKMFRQRLLAFCKCQKVHNRMGSDETVAMFISHDNKLGHQNGKASPTKVVQIDTSV